MPIYTANQQEIAEKISDSVTISNWKDWRWQLKHSIQDIESVETLLGIGFGENERRKLELTLRKFPHSDRRPALPLWW